MTPGGRALTPAQELEALACKGVYTAADTARHFGVSESTIRRVWAHDTEGLVLPEPPNIWDTRTTPDLIVADTQILLDRGHTLAYVLGYFGITWPTLARAHVKASRGYRVRDGAGEYVA